MNSSTSATRNSSSTFSPSPSFSTSTRTNTSSDTTPTSTTPTPTTTSTTSTSSSTSNSSTLPPSSTTTSATHPPSSSVSSESESVQSSISTSSSVHSTSTTSHVPGSSSTATPTVSVSTVIVSHGVTYTTSYPFSTTSASSGGGGGGGSSNIGAIVGGVVGGIVGLFLLLLLGYFCMRRKQKEDDDFDGNWDPDRTIQRPATLPATGNLDLTAESAGVDTSPRPFPAEGSGGPYSPTSYLSGNHFLAAGTAAATGAAATGIYHDDQYPHQRQMSQHDATSGGAPSIPSSASAYPASSEAYGPSSSPAGRAGAVMAAGGQPMRINKQQEAAQAYAESHPGFSGRPEIDSTPMNSGEDFMEGSRGLSVANPDDQNNNLMSRGSSFMQHRDAGRIPEPMAQDNFGEVPPSYDSIRPDDIGDGDSAATPRPR